jgi:hypothetical protein
MSWERAAAAIARQWPDRGDRITMLAIGAAESGEFTNLHGDPVNTLPAYERYGCSGFLSHGILQVFAGVHFDKLAKLTGSSDPCVWSGWLEDFDNCARAAKWVWDERGGGPDGFMAWSAYKAGSYGRYWVRAVREIDSLEPVLAPLVLPAAALGALATIERLHRELAAAYKTLREAASG